MKLSDAMVKFGTPSSATRRSAGPEEDFTVPPQVQISTYGGGLLTWCDRDGTPGQVTVTSMDQIGETAGNCRLHILCKNPYAAKNRVSELEQACDKHCRLTDDNVTWSMAINHIHTDRTHTVHVSVKILGWTV